MHSPQEAQKTKASSKATASYALVTCLPEKYRIPEIISPSLIGDPHEEAAYVGLCTFIVSLVMLSTDGSLPDHKLMRYLRRTNADENMPMERTAAVLLKMQRQGYIVKVLDRNGDEETVDWIVGAKGKVEIGAEGAKGLVMEVYGQSYGQSAPEDLEKRVNRSLGLDSKKRRDVPEEEAESNINGKRRQARRAGGELMAVDDD